MKEHNSRLTFCLLVVFVCLMVQGCVKNDLGQDIPDLPAASSNVQIDLPPIESGGGAEALPTVDSTVVDPYPGADDGSAVVDPGVVDSTGSDSAEILVPSEGSAETDQTTTDNSAEVVAPVVEQPEPQYPLVHVVQANETVGSIAEQYGVSIDDIIAANDFFDINFISIGDQITIDPGAASAAVDAGTGDDAQPVGFDPNNFFIHTVAFQETLFSIAVRYGFTVEELASYNGLADINQSDHRQQLKIPTR